MTRKKSKGMVQMTIRIPPEQAAFIERKKSELQRSSIVRPFRKHISNSTIIQGILAFWMAMDRALTTENRGRKRA